MKIEAGVTEVLESIAEFIEVASAAAKGHRHFHALAKIESLEARLRRKLRLRFTEVAHHAAKVAPQGSDRSIVANVESRELLGQIAPVRGGERPLREIVRKTLREEVMGPQSLKSVMKDGSVAAMLEAGQQFRKSSGRLVSDTREVGSGYEVEWCFGNVQCLRPLILRCAGANPV